MKRLLFLTLVALCGLVEVCAQGSVGTQYNVTVKNSKGEPLEGVLVYSFVSEKQGKAAYDVASKSLAGFEDPDIDKDKFGLIAEGKTDETGYCVINCMAKGAIVLDGADIMSGSYGMQLYNVKDYISDKLDIDIDLVLAGKTYISWSEDGKRHIHDENLVNSEFVGGGEETMLKTVEHKASPMMDKIAPRVTRFDRDYIEVTAPVEIEGEYARSDARFVVFPHIVFEEKDTTVYMPPVAVQGENYTKSMERRMSFDTSHDKLNAYRFDHSMYMQNHGSEQFLYSQLAHITKGTKYRIPGDLWYEDYNGVYHCDSMIFSEGKEQEPMRFLDWSSVRKLAPIDRELFVRKGKLEALPENASFNLDFVVNTAQLRLTDSTTVAQRDSMMRWINGYYSGRDGSAISDIIIRGYSSPEGREERNIELSHGRAATIKALLASRFPGVDIKMQFDEHDNVVTWDSISNILLSDMDDSLARKYAVQIKEIIADKSKMNDQYEAIQKAGGGLYEYLKENVLGRVRKVDVQANIIVRKVYSKEEIIAMYETDPDFRQNMIEYQYYAILCYLADKERWDELYDVAKRAYEKYPTDMTVRKQFRITTDQEAKNDTTPGRLRTVDAKVPYPLAGYYYAAATLKKGMSDVNILKPYLDDGKTGVREVMNSLPFVANQVLMYCQRESFNEAADMVARHNLEKHPELYGLVMFVKCLGGHYQDPGPEGEKVRQYIMGTSDMNKAVLHAALGSYREALKVLYGPGVPKNDAKVEYLKAICHFNLLNSRQRALDVDGYSSGVVYNSDDDDSSKKSEYETNTVTWAAPMLNALRLEKSNVKYLENDGYFNNAYRQMIMYFWTRMQAGVPIAKVAREYDALVAQMRANAEKKNK